MYVESLLEKKFIAIVEDNNDPKKMGRVKSRVINVFDDIDIDSIPWSTPDKDLNGNVFNIPEIGKIVTVYFDNGDPYKPIYESSEHYNKNLDAKLKGMSDEDYISFKALHFDDKLQVYSNDSEGFIVDYMYNNMNIKEGSINLNLKDNHSTLNLGDEISDQQAILGNHWMDWFDKFVEVLLGDGGGAYIGNLGSPVTPSPKLIKVMMEYKRNKDPKFLSKHVNIIDNNSVSTVKGKDRVDINSKGDDWVSNFSDNISYKNQQNSSFSPKDGDFVDYDSDYVAPNTDGTPDTLIPNNDNPILPSESDGIVSKLIKFMEYKKYKVEKTPNVLNIVGLRNKPKGLVTNKFDEIMYVFYIDSNNKWKISKYSITTVPGLSKSSNQLPNKVAVLQLGQYINQYKLGYHQGKKDHKCLKFANSVVHRNDNGKKYNFKARTEQGSFGINIHRSNKNGNGINVNNWSMGCQVFKNSGQFNQFIKLCEKQEKKKASFTYTLIDELEYNNFGNK